MGTHENQLKKIFRKHPAVEFALSELGYSSHTNISLDIKRVDKELLTKTGTISDKPMENTVNHLTKKYPGTVHSLIFLLTEDEKHNENMIVFSRKNFTASNESVRDLITYFGRAYSDYQTKITGILIAYKYSWYPSEKLGIGNYLAEIAATLYLKPKESWFDLLADLHYSLACEDAKEDCCCLHIKRTDEDVRRMAEDRRRRERDKIKESPTAYLPRFQRR